MSFLGEIKRRKVFQVTAVYAVVAWLLIQIVATVEGPLNLPGWFDTTVIVALAIGFPIAVVLAWAFELTPDGVVRDHGTSVAGRGRTRSIDYVLMALLAIAVGTLLYREFATPGDEVGRIAGRLPNSVAVLPCRNDSPNPIDASFASGVHEAILDRLARFRDLHAIARTSVMQFANAPPPIPEIARVLNVETVMECSVRYAGSDVVVSARLIDAETNSPMWGRTYTGNTSDLSSIFGFQAEIAIDIAESLEAELLPTELARLSKVLTNSLPALQAYYSGLELIVQRDAPSLQAAIRKFSTATEFDENFSEAWSGLAEAWVELPNYAPNTDPTLVRSESEKAARNAVASDSTSPYAQAVLGWYRLRYEYDWAGAERAFLNALDVKRTNVHALHWYSHLLSWRGESERAVAFAQEALDADPSSTLIRTNLSYILADARDWDAAFELGDAILRTDEYSSLMINLWIAHLRAERPQEAARYLERWAMATDGDINVARELSTQIIQARDSGQSSNQIESLVSRLLLSNSLPEIYAAAGDSARTIAALQSAYDEGTGDRSLLSMKINPSYDLVRKDREYTILLEKVGLGD